MKLLLNPPRSEWKALCERPASRDAAVREVAAGILERVRRERDKALKELSAEIDGWTPESLEVSREEIDSACAAVPEKLKAAIRKAASNIRAFHEAQMPHTIEVETSPGVVCSQRPVPIDSVGLYVPGGTAPLFSTVLMLAVPAAIAGCRDVVLCTPAGREGKVAPAVLYAASLCGVKRIFKTGGAQAIAAMALGTESIPKVDKIFGPGNAYVTAAKQLVAGSLVSVDMPAGPSEVMVLADSETNPRFAAADLLSQAEHGKDSQSMLLASGKEVAEAVCSEVERRVKELPRSALALSSLGHSLAIVFEDRQDMIDFAETYAPEHLIISTSDADSVCEKISAAGSVFVGAYTPESAGDYASGTNHTLPTSGWARSCSGVNLESFMRRMTVQRISREGLAGLSDTIIEMAEAEGLRAHADAVRIRLDDN